MKFSLIVHGFIYLLHETMMVNSLIDLVIMHNWLQYCLIKTQNRVLVSY